MVESNLIIYTAKLETFFCLIQFFKNRMCSKMKNVQSKF